MLGSERVVQVTSNMKKLLLVGERMAGINVSDENVRIILNVHMPVDIIKIFYLSYCLHVGWRLFVKFKKMIFSVIF